MPEPVTLTKKDFTSDSEVRWCYLDVDEVVRNRQRTLPPVAAIERPGFVPGTPRGTVVRLLRCDRLEYRRASALAQRLAAELGGGHVAHAGTCASRRRPAQGPAIHTL